MWSNSTFEFRNNGSIVLLADTLNNTGIVEANGGAGNASGLGAGGNGAVFTEELDIYNVETSATCDGIDIITNVPLAVGQTQLDVFCYGNCLSVP